MIKSRGFATNRRLIIPAVATLGVLGIIVKSRSPADETANASSQGDRARSKRDSDALQGAGIGGNMQSGGFEKGSFTGKGDNDQSVQTTASSRDELPSGGGIGGGHGGGNSNTRAVEMRPATGGGTPGRGSGSEATGEEGGMMTISREDSLKSRSGSGSGGEIGSDPNIKTTTQSYPGNPGTGVLSPGTSTLSRYGESHQKKSGNHPSASQRLQGFLGTGGSSVGEAGENTKKFHDTRVHSNLTGQPTKRDTMRSNS